MNEYDIDDILRSYSNRLNHITEDFHRYLYFEIDWDDRLIGIKGPRGCGKTTLLLQHIKENFPQRKKALYVSLDNLWFTTHTLIELADYHYTHGGTHLFIDEIHHYPQWQQALKNIYDDYPDLHIVYTGSSMLVIDYKSADLSRRQMLYYLSGMSFREYLQFEKIIDLSPLTLDYLLLNHQEIASNICAQVKILPLFETYLKHGYYPFYKEVKKGFEWRLQQVVAQVLESDYPQIDEIMVSTIRKTRKMLKIIAERVLQVPSMNELYRELETDRNQGLKMLYALQRGGLIALLSDNTKSMKMLSRPEKIFLNNSNLMYALSSVVDKGTLRETFFFNQLSHDNEVYYPPKGDFLVNKKYLFEVGGKNKSFEQIKDVENSFLAIDDIEIGHHNKIPLWMFGLLY